MEPTTLVLSSGAVFFAMRDASQTLTPIGEATAQRRTINGAKRNVAPPAFRKFASEISCTDQAAPVWRWPGQIITVDCITELNYPTGSGAPERTVVPGSTRQDSGYTFYRPRLTMMVTNYSVDKTDWQGNVSWTLSLEEV